jgi:enoyl-CoA hydratase
MPASFSRKVIIAVPEEVLVNRSDAIGTITLNRPDKLNAFTPDMYLALGDALDELNRDVEMRVIVLEGAGRAFSAGYVVNVDSEGMTLAERERFMRDVSNACRWKIWNSDTPVVVKAHGYCLGAAFELALPADFTIVAEDCQLGEPEITLGYGIGFLMLPWLVGPKVAKDLVLTGRRVSGMEAAACGVVTRAVPGAELDREVQTLADGLAKLPAAPMTAMKRGINRAYEARGMVSAVDSSVDLTLYLYATEGEEAQELRMGMVKGDKAVPTS